MVKGLRVRGQLVRVENMGGGEFLVASFQFFSKELTDDSQQLTVNSLQLRSRK